MRIRILFSVAIALGVAAPMAGCASQDAAKPVPASHQPVFQTVRASDIKKTNTPSSEFAARTIVLVNQERTKRGLQALIVDERLNRAAEFHVKYMATKDCFAHVCPRGPTVAQRMDDAGFVNSMFSENILAGATTPEMAVEGWMNSPGHRANILTPDLREVGAAYLFHPDDGGKERWRHYWGMNFGVAVKGYAATTGGGAPDAKIVASAVELINNKRKAAGLPALRMDSRLNEAAGNHAATIARTRCLAGGKCPDGNDIAESLTALGYGYKAFWAQSAIGLMEPGLLADRLAKNSDSPVLGRQFSEIGAGYYFDPKETGDNGHRLYWIVYVAVPAGSTGG